MKRILTFLLAVGLLGVGYWAFGLWTAERIARDDPTIEGYERAIAWNPGSDGFHALLGTSYRDRLGDQDLEAAVAELRTAVRLNPRVWTHHVDLAVTLEIAGDLDGAEQEFEKALELNPYRTELRWQVANFYLRRQKIPQAIAHFRIAVEQDPGRLGLAADRLDAAGVTTAEIGEKLVPDDRRDQLIFLSFVLRRLESEPEEADRMAWQTWQAWQQAPAIDGFRISSVFGYINFLVRREEFRRAEQVWRAALREAGLAGGLGDGGEDGRTGEREDGRTGGGEDQGTRGLAAVGRNGRPGDGRDTTEGLRSPTGDQTAARSPVLGFSGPPVLASSGSPADAAFDLAPGADCVFNGGFEAEPLGGGFGWVLPRDSRIYYERDYRERFEGMASLRIEFGGESNPDYTGPHQMLILPAGRLRLEFTARSEGITSDQGISVELVVLADRRRLAGAGPSGSTRCVSGPRRSSGARK
ncbi:MAG: tetratricopeptide repeat protein [Acidobacteriota bacterium]